MQTQCNFWWNLENMSFNDKHIQYIGWDIQRVLFDYFELTLILLIVIVFFNNLDI